MTPLYHPRPERWPQFTLKGLLIAVTLAALLLPWAIAEYRMWQFLREVDDELAVQAELNRGRGYLAPNRPTH